MRNLTKDNITDAFVHYCNQTGDEVNPRTMEIMSSLAKHLHAFALETKLTHEEWHQGVEFIKQVGHKTTPERDELVLLSDVLGLSSLIDMVHNNRGNTNTNEVQAKVPTSSSVLGPFHLSNPPKLPMGSDLKHDNDGELVLVQGSILDAKSGKPISGATVNVWQTASNGLYSSQDPKQDHFNFHGLLSSTGEDGIYSFTTSKPIPYQIPTDGPVGDLLKALGRHGWRPSHLHYIVQAEGYTPLVTEIFPHDDPYLEGDAVFGVRDDLVLTYRRQPADAFPSTGFDLSGKVKESFWKVDFDLILTPLAE